MESVATITVRHLRPIKSKSVYALVDADIEIAGITISVFGIQTRHLPNGGTSIHLPTYRDASGTWRAAVALPDEIREGLCDAILGFLIEEGIAVHAGTKCTMSSPDADPLLAAD